MERITTLMTSQRTINDINQALDRLNVTQQQLTTGKRINQPSDDPYGASLAIQLNGDLAGLGAYSRNISDGTAWTQTADASLGNIGNIVQRVRELVVEGANNTNNQSGLTAAAAEVDQLTEAIKQEANSSYDGQHIFSGTTTTTAPYQSGATDTYQGNTGVINRQIGPGATVQVNTDISQLLGNGLASGDGKLLDVLRTVSQDLKTGNTNGLGTDLTSLDKNIDTLSQLQANVGAVENRLQLASSRIQDLQVSQQRVLSNTQDADLAQTSINYSTEQAAFTAALKASATIVQSSLLDFLR
jgi:flagellar hook-associated protein 3 FlgL